MVTFSKVGDTALGDASKKSIGLLSVSLEVRIRCGLGEQREDAVQGRPPAGRFMVSFWRRGGQCRLPARLSPCWAVSIAVALDCLTRWREEPPWA